MSEPPKPSTIRLLIGIIIGMSLALIALAVWMIANHEGPPVLVAVTGSMLAAFAAILAARSKKKG